MKPPQENRQPPACERCPLSWPVSGFLLSADFRDWFYQFFLFVLSVICGFTVWFLIEAWFVS
jgi:hypothetical protein|tara:strand:+ start:1504 stop:1689 length:186 start_codon:yes stop_codon:yes gene_type:complete